MVIAAVMAIAAATTGFALASAFQASGIAFSNSGYYLLRDIINSVIHSY